MVHIDTDTTTEPGVVRLHVRGQLDMLARGVFGEALTWAARLRRPVEVDLGKIDFIDGAGLSLLMEARRRARSAGRRLTIIGASRCVRRLIEITNTADSLPLLPRPPATRRTGARSGASARTGAERRGPGRRPFRV
ncbi:MAG TPA: STAS domain-containing protein [Solirubrobacteraceae bacterium]|jgi:anti-anti-sigma factor